MANAESGKKLFRVVIDGCIHFATGDSAFAAFAKVIDWEDGEGNSSHKETLGFSVEAEQVGTTNVEVLAWDIR